MTWTANTSDNPNCPAKSDLQILGGAELCAFLDQEQQIDAAIDQGIEYYRQNLFQLRELRRKRQRRRRSPRKVMQKLQASIERAYGYCFDLSGKGADFDEVAKWLEVNVSGPAVLAGHLVGIKDPDGAFYFKVRWQ